MYYLIIFAAVFFLALQFALNRAYEIQVGNAVKTSLIFTALTGAATAVVSLIIAFISKDVFVIAPYSIVMAVVVAALCCSYTLIGFKVMSLGSLSVYMMFLMLGGMLLPYIFGVIYLNEEISVFRIIGVILLIISLVFPVIARGKQGKASALFLILCISVFCLNGCVSITSKLHQIEALYETSSSAIFSFLIGISNSVMSSCVLLVYTLKNSRPKGTAQTETKSPVKKTKIGKIMLIIAASSVFGGISSILQFVAAGKIPASMLYPIITGGSVVLTAVAGVIFFKEKPDKISLYGLILSFAATFLFLF